MALIDEISGLVLWLRAEDLSAVGDGNNVTTWEDASAEGNDVTQGTAGIRPNWEDSLFQFNSKPAVLANGTADTLAANVLDLTGVAGLTVFAVQYASNHGLSGRTNACLIGRDTSGDRGWAVGMDNDGTLFGRGFLVIASSTTARTRRDGNLLDLRDLPCVLTCRFEGGAEMIVRVNGADDTGAIDDTIPATIANDGGTACNVFSNTFTDDWGGYLAELVVYDETLSDQNMEAVERYLMGKYGLIGLREISEGPNTECHQGYTYDPVNNKHYTIDTDRIDKRADDGSWTVEANNTTPFSGVATVNHLGDGHYYNGLLYVPMEFWGGSCGSFSDMKLAIFDADTLTRISVTDISAQGHEVSGCVVVPHHGSNGIIYVTSFCDDTQIFKYDLSDMSYLGALTLSGDTVDRLQGIAFRDNQFYLSGSTGFLWRMSTAGVVRTIWRDTRESGTVAFEGIDFNSSGTLRWLIDENTSSATADKHVHYLALVETGAVVPRHRVASQHKWPHPDQVNGCARRAKLPNTGLTAPAMQPKTRKTRMNTLSPIDPAVQVLAGRTSRWGFANTGSTPMGQHSRQRRAAAPVLVLGGRVTRGQSYRTGLSASHDLLTPNIGGPGLRMRDRIDAT